ncbi:hypothetical protein DZF91_31075, partial [Actinomadura logoneensis]
AGRRAARAARQPEVIGELTAGLLAGPAALWLLGRHTFDQLVPGDVLADLKLATETGLVLFLSGLTHKLRIGEPRPDRRAVGWVAAGSLLPAQAAGWLLAGWVLWRGSPAVRGDAPALALALMIAVTLSVTAVPVLARVLTDRGMADTEVGRLSLTASIVIDGACWLLLAVAIGLGSGSPERFARAMAVLACGAGAAVLLRLVLRTRGPDALSRRVPWLAALLISVVAVTLGFTMERLGMTAIIGAALAGLAVPATEAWSTALRSVTAIGRVMVPVFFVLGGLKVLGSGFGAVSVALIVPAVLLGIAGKTLGGYLGARLGDRTRWDAMRIGALMNTRGLTELIVLQAGYSAGILTTPLFLALVVMALVTTAMTGPALGIIDRAEMRRRPVDAPETVPSVQE